MIFTTWGWWLNRCLMWEQESTSKPTSWHWALWTRKYRFFWLKLPTNVFRYTTWSALEETMFKLIIYPLKRKSRLLKRVKATQAILIVLQLLLRRPSAPSTRQRTINLIRATPSTTPSSDEAPINLHWKSNKFKTSSLFLTRFCITLNLTSNSTSNSMHLSMPEMQI